MSRVRADPAAAEQAVEVLEDLDWCLEQLEAVQTHRSLSELASSKVRRLASPRLSSRSLASLALLCVTLTRPLTPHIRNIIRSDRVASLLHSIPFQSIPFHSDSDLIHTPEMI